MLYRIKKRINRWAFIIIVLISAVIITGCPPDHPIEISISENE